MTLPPPKVCQRIRALHALMGSSHPKEAENAKAKLIQLLAKIGRTWNDLTGDSCRHRCPRQQQQ
jgi:hypothetical protein